MAISIPNSANGRLTSKSIPLFWGRKEVPLTLFDIDEGSVTVTNLTDGGTAAHTIVANGDGTTITNTEFNDILAFDTGLDTTGDMHIRQTIDIASPASGKISGISLFDGVNRTRFQFLPVNGQLYIYGTLGQSTGQIATGLYTAATGVATQLVIDYYVRTDDNSVTIYYSKDGRAPYSFHFTGIAVGSVEILASWNNAATHTIEYRDLSLSADFTIQASDFHNPLSFTERSIPAGFTYTIPGGFKFYRDSGTFYSSISLSAPVPMDKYETKTIYVDKATGSDTNEGSATAPLKSLHVAAELFQSGSRGTIKAKGGTYGYSNCFRNYLKGSALQILSWDGVPVKSSMHYDTFTWSSSSGAYTATLPTGSVINVFDASTLTSDGDYTILSKAADVATCQSTAGTWFQSGTSVYVHTSDSREPDSDIRVYVKEVGGGTDIYGLNLTTTNAVLYLDGVELEGGKWPFYMQSTTSNGNQQVYFKGGAVKYGESTGLKTQTTGLIVLDGTVAAENGADGFNYQPSSSGGAATFAIELNTIGRSNGHNGDGTANGSSSHGAGVIRVGSVYHDNFDRQLHDIDQSGNVGMSINFGVEARDPRTSDSNFCAGISAGSDTSKMWLDNCISSGGTYDIEANASATVYTDGFSGDATNDVNDSATVTTYTA